MNGAPHRPLWQQVGQGVTENVTWRDGFNLLLGAIFGLAGNALFNRAVPTAFSLVVLGLLTFCAVFSISRALNAMQASATGDLRRLHDELQEKLKKHLNRVHASASFVPDASGANGAPANCKLGYDAPTAAVRRAQERIFAVSHYCPPREEGAALDEPPKHRSEYLHAIEDMLNGHLEDGLDPVKTLEYRRFIQRPANVYNKIKRREDARLPGIALEPGDMIGDEQVFEHCKRVLEIASEAERRGSDRIRVQIKVIPFLPNCPSVLLVDNRDLYFTIPTRIDRPGDSYARQGLLGVLAVEDKAGGSEISDAFEELFSRLTQFSATVTKIENKNSTATGSVNRAPDG